jgi:hypothetical protein
LEAIRKSDKGIRPLEDIFGNTVARVLDFFIINEPFDYSLAEISQITNTQLNATEKIIPSLVEKGLLKEKGKKGEAATFALNINHGLTVSLKQCVLARINSEIAMEKVSRRARRKVSAPGIKGV